MKGLIFTVIAFLLIVPTAMAIDPIHACTEMCTTDQCSINCFIGADINVDCPQKCEAAGLPDHICANICRPGKVTASVDTIRTFDAFTVTNPMEMPASALSISYLDTINDEKNLVYLIVGVLAAFIAFYLLEKKNHYGSRNCKDIGRKKGGPDRKGRKVKIPDRKKGRRKPLNKRRR